MAKLSRQQDRQPRVLRNFEQIAWRRIEGSNVYVDSKVLELENLSIYRYASIAESLSLHRGTLTLASPRLWPDKYEQGVSDRLFGIDGSFKGIVPVAKCFSLEYSSEALWRIYAGTGGLVRIGFPLRKFVAALTRTKCVEPGRLFLGRVQYLDAVKLRAAIAAVIEEIKTASEEQAMQAICMKRAGFSFENEVRLCFMRTHGVVSDLETLKGFDFACAKRILLDPYLPKWQCDELIEMYKRAGVPCEVSQSGFDQHPKLLKGWG